MHSWSDRDRDNYKNYTGSALTALSSSINGIGNVSRASIETRTRKEVDGQSGT